MSIATGPDARPGGYRLCRDASERRVDPASESEKPRKRTMGSVCRSSRLSAKPADTLRSVWIDFCNSRGSRGKTGAQFFAFLWPRTTPSDDRVLSPESLLCDADCLYPPYSPRCNGRCDRFETSGSIERGTQAVCRSNLGDLPLKRNPKHPRVYWRSGRQGLRNFGPSETIISNRNGGGGSSFLPGIRGGLRPTTYGPSV